MLQNGISLKVLSIASDTRLMPGDLNIATSSIVERISERRRRDDELTSPSYLTLGRNVAR